LILILSSYYYSELQIKRCLLRIEQYSAQNQNSWNHFLTHTNTPNFLFHRDFMDYHKARFCDHSLLIYDKDELVALLPAHQEKNLIYSHLGLSFGGILTTPDCTLSQFILIFEAILQYFQTQEVDTLILNEIPFIYAHSPVNHLAFLSHVLEAKLQRIQLLSTLDFHHPSPLNTNRKRMIKKGIKNGYIISETTSPAAFWDEILLPRLADRYTTTPVHTLAEITGLMQSFPQQIKQFCVYTASGQLVGGTTIFIHDHVVHLQYIAGKEEDNANGALDLLIYTLLEQYKSSVRYFDFGSSHLHENQLNKGLIYWKESFGARSIPQYCYAFSIQNLEKIQQIIH